MLPQATTLVKDNSGKAMTGFESRVLPATSSRKALGDCVTGSRFQLGGRDWGRSIDKIDKIR